MNLLAVDPTTSTRDAILDAAEHRFAGRGFEGVSVRDVIADAGLRNQASLYHYFPSKRLLYEAVLRRRVDELAGLWDGVDGGDLDAIFRYLSAHPEVARLLERAGLDDDPFVRESIPRLLGPLYTRGLRTLEAATSRWSRDQLPHVASGFYHLVFGYFANASLLQAVLGADPLSPAMLARQRMFLEAAITQLLDGPRDPARGDIA